MRTYFSKFENKFEKAHTRKCTSITIHFFQTMYVKENKSVNGPRTMRNKLDF